MDNIEALLKEKGLTKTAFSDLLGVKKQNLNGLMKNPTLETIKRFASVLGVETWQLFTESPGENDICGFIKVKGSIYELKSKEDVKKVLEMLE